MAKLERILQGDFDELVQRIENGIIGGSLSASLEDGSDFSNNGVRIAVRVFERYSYFGGNRVSLNVTICQVNEGDIMLSAITSGGSQAVFFKVNTIGEEAFLEKLEKLI